MARVFIENQERRIHSAWDSHRLCTHTRHLIDWRPSDSNLWWAQGPRSSSLCAYLDFDTYDTHVGATGVYQAYEMYLQLTGRAGPNQVPRAKVV